MQDTGVLLLIIMIILLGGCVICGAKQTFCQKSMNHTNSKIPLLEDDEKSMTSSQNIV